MSGASAGLVEVALQQQAGNLDTITPAGGLVLVKDPAGSGEGLLLGAITEASVNETPVTKGKASHPQTNDGAESGENGHLSESTSAAEKLPPASGGDDPLPLKETTTVSVEAKPDGEVTVVVNELAADMSATGGTLSNEEFGSTTSSSETDSETDEELDNIKTEIEKRLPPSISDIALAERVQVRHVHLLYNPMSGNRRGEKVMRRAKRKLEERGLQVTATRLERKGHAEQLCETMDFTGIDVVCAVGGDGTFHECVNGMMKRLHPNFVNEYRGGLKNRRGSFSEMPELVRSRGEEGSGGNGSSSESEYAKYKRNEELKQRKKVEKRERKLKEKEEKAKGKEREKEERETEKNNKKKERLMRKEGLGSLAVGSKANKVRIHVEEVFLPEDDEESKKRKAAIASRLAEKKSSVHSETLSPVSLDPKAERAMKQRWTLPGRMRRKPLKEGDARYPDDDAGDPEDWEKQKQRDEDEADADADRGYESEGEKKKRVDKVKKGGTKSDDEGQITRSGANRINRRLPSLPGSKRRKKRNAHKKESELKDTREPKEQKDPVKHGAKTARRLKKKQSHSHRPRPSKLLQEVLEPTRSTSFESASPSPSPSLMTQSSPALSVSTTSWPSSPNLSGSLTPPRSPPSESLHSSADSSLSPPTSEGRDVQTRRKRSVDASGDDLLVPKTGARGRVPPLALIAAGTGNSFMHEIGCAKMKQAVDHICRGAHYPLDICRLYFGDDSTCYSFNSIHWGLASKVNVTAEKLRWMGNAIRYTTAVFVQMMKGKTTLARISLVDENDNVIEYDESFCLAIANNIITASKGMKMAPTAKIDDGLLDLLLITTSSSIELMHIFKKVYDGSHVDLPYVRYIKVKKFSITPYKIREKEKDNKEEHAEDDIEEIEELLDVDGELKGCTPFTCEVLPRALRFIL